MKKLLRLEELAELLGSFVLFYLISPGLDVWMIVVLFFLPDAGALGYLINRNVGAVGYNLLHHKLVCISILAIGYLYADSTIMAVGILFYAHSCFDRAIGYGLKHFDSPSHTHLGYIGKEKFKNNLTNQY